MADTTLLEITRQERAADGLFSRAGLRALPRRLYADGKADLAALGRCLRSLGRLLRRSWRRAGSARELDATDLKVGLAALDLAPDLPERASALAHRSAVRAQEEELVLLRAALVGAEGELSGARGEARTLLGYLEEEKTARDRELAAARERARSDPGASAALGALDRAAAEVAERIAAKEKDWKDRERTLELARRAASARVARAEQELRAAEARMGPACRELGRELRRRADLIPELQTVLAEARAVAAELEGENAALAAIERELRADRFRGLRAAAVLLVAVVLVVLLWPSSPGSAATRRRGGDAPKKTAAPPTEPVAPAATAGELEPAAITAIGAELAAAIRALPALAAAGLEPAGELRLLESRPAAGGLVRLAVAIAGHRRRGDETIPAVANLSLLVDGEGRILEAAAPALVDPEDEELFRLLEERP